MSLDIDFYVLEAGAQKSLHFSCRLIEKAYENQKRIFIHTNSREEADQIDSLLWTYKDDSFLAHHFYDPEIKHPALIQIGVDQEPVHAGDVLINFQQTVPGFYQKFQQVIEIVYTDPLVQQWARMRYKQYRDLGHDIHTYKLKANEI